MSLARAFTQRVKRVQEVTAAGIHRGHTVRHGVTPASPIVISSPVELLSTTNVQALNAPDIPKISTDIGTSSASSTHSGDDSIFSAVDRSFLSHATGHSTPATPNTPYMEPAKDFFESKIVPTTPAEPAAPSVPQRSPSHSKRAHVELSRQMSVKRMSPPPSSAAGLQRAASVRDTVDMFSREETTRAASESAHPFGPELAQVNEVAEEFAPTNVVLDAEEQYMLDHGLQKFGVVDYINEIVGLYNGGVYENRLGFGLNPWM